MPTTAELLLLLKLPKVRSPWDSRNRILTWIMFCGLFVLIICGLLARVDLFPVGLLGWIGLSSYGLAVVAWVLVVGIEILKLIPSIRDPATEMANQFDLECGLENDVIPKFHLLPVELILERHRRLEWQLARWEKWLDVARLMGMLGPMLIFVGNGLGGKHILSNAGTSIELLVASMLTGILIGAIGLRAGIKKLQWVSQVLRRASEKSRPSPRLRKRLHKRR